MGELRTPQIRGLKVGPQSLSMTDAGVDSITFDGTGTEFQLKVTPMPGRNLGTPVVSSDGRDLTVRFNAPQLPVSQTARVDLRAPARVPTASFVPPLRPRAVAPPSGDIAVGTMTIRNRGYLSLYGPAGDAHHPRCQSARCADGAGPDGGVWLCLLRCLAWQGGVNSQAA